PPQFSGVRYATRAPVVDDRRPRKASARLERSSADDARVAVVRLERQAEQRRRVDAAAVLAPDADRVPGAEEVAVLALLVDDGLRQVLLPRLPLPVAVLVERVGRVVPVVVVDRAVLRVPDRRL